VVYCQGFQGHSITKSPTKWNDGITGNALVTITQGSGWYLQFGVGVDVLEIYGSEVLEKAESITILPSSKNNYEPKLNLLLFMAI